MNTCKFCNGKLRIINISTHCDTCKCSFFDECHASTKGITYLIGDGYIDSIHTYKDSVIINFFDKNPITLPFNFELPPAKMVDKIKRLLLWI